MAPQCGSGIRYRLVEGPASAPRLLPGNSLPPQDRVADRRAASDHAANPYYRPVDLRIGNDRAIGDNRPLNLRSATLLGGR